jgi:pimeloyl-ACP methyl ester carboxylesterase
MSELGEIPPTVEAQVPDVDTIREATGAERIALYGLSQGAAVALLYARRFPERVSHLILVEGVCCDASDPEQPLSSDNALMDWDAFFESGERDFANFTMDVACMAFPSFTEDAQERVAGILRMTVTPASCRALWQGVVGLDLRPILKEIAVPTLVIHASGDRHHPVEQGRYMAQQIPGAQYLELDSDCHLPSMDEKQVPVLLVALEEFLTGSVQHTAERRVATIVFTDIVGSTDHQRARGDLAWRDALELHQANTKRVVEQFGGRVVDTRGDGDMSEFSSPGQALRAARALLDSAHAEGLQIRAGVHAGEVYDVGDRLIGICINQAARVIAEATPDEILTTGVVQGLVDGSGYEFMDRGEFELKGIGRRRLVKLK